MSNTLQLTYGYQSTDFTRKVSIGNVAESLSAATIKANIKAVNASIAGGTSDGLPTFFRSDDFNATQSVGAFTGITAAKLTSQTVTNIDLDTEGDATGE